MRFLVTGQLTLHWGRLEFGNIGNYYIIEPFFQGLHRKFPNADIRTTFQLSEGFRNREQIEVLPARLYYDFESRSNLADAKKELEWAELSRSGQRVRTSEYMEAVRWSDAVIDLSGDIWGDNADFLGPDRLETGLLKDLTAQALGRPAFMLAGSPGPFHDARACALAKKAFSQFALVTNREPVSTALLREWGFDLSNTATLPCPSFLFQPAPAETARKLLRAAGLLSDHRPIIGLILCGWNFSLPPFDRWPREDAEYETFLSALAYICGHMDANICLMSHSNGFSPPPAEFRLKHGRDYPVIKQLEVLIKERCPDAGIYALDGIYDARTAKAVIGQFDMLISGRVHGAAAGFSQCVPTVVIDYGHEPKAHKVRGFSMVAGQEAYIADPASADDMIAKVRSCWENRDSIRAGLQERIPKVRAAAEETFELVRKKLAGMQGGLI